MSTVMSIMAEKILAKDAQAEAAIAADKAAILAANTSWNAAAVATANAHISAINAQRVEDSGEESAKIKQIQEDLSATINEIIDNEIPPTDSIVEANKALDEDMQEFEKALEISVADLQVVRDQFSARAGNSTDFLITAIIGFEPSGIE